MKHINRSTESGVISIFAVIMFMIFISIIAVGFIRVINDERRQALDNELSASAYSSAQSGVEEAKRLYLYCQNTAIGAVERAACTSLINNTACDAVTGATARPALTALGIAVEEDASINRAEGVVSAEDRFEQRWGCMTIVTDTDDFRAKLTNVTGTSAGKGTLVPLRATGDFTSINLSWHETNGSDGIPTLRPSPADATRISQPEWSDAGYPAMLRVQLIGHPKGNLNIDALDAASRTLVLFPSLTGVGTSAWSFDTDVRLGDQAAHVAGTTRRVRCQTTTIYACSVNLTLGALPSSVAYDYYLRITPYYEDTNVVVSLTGPTGPLKFAGVQPQVDVTGRTNDVFRRVEARLGLEEPYIPNFAIESSESFCKTMTVADDAAESTDNICP